jgi:hypothetical protein
MDIAGFQVIFPELIVSYENKPWHGSGLQSYNFVFNEWQDIADGANVQLFTKVNVEAVEGAIRSTKIHENTDVALIYTSEATGLVRGKRLREDGEMDFAFDDFSFDNTSQHKSDNFEAPGFF